MSQEPTQEPTQAELMKRAYRDALECQNACNLSAVLYAFKQHMETICKEYHVNQGPLSTHARNTHPIVKMFLSKLVSLAQMDNGDFGDADKKCCEGAGMTMDEYRATF